jgi:hypothetical protein
MRTSNRRVGFAPQGDGGGSFRWGRPWEPGLARPMPSARLFSSWPHSPISPARRGSSLRGAAASRSPAPPARRPHHPHQRTNRVRPPTRLQPRRTRAHHPTTQLTPVHRQGVGKRSTYPGSPSGSGLLRRGRSRSSDHPEHWPAARTPRASSYLLVVFPCCGLRRWIAPRALAARGTFPNTGAAEGFTDRSTRQPTSRAGHRRLRAEPPRDWARR